MKNIKWSALFISIAYVAGGLLFFIYPYTSKIQLCTWVAYAGLILGLYNMVAYLIRSKQKSFFKNDFMVGLLLITIGLIILLHPDYFVDLIYLILAVAIMLSGYSKLQDVVDSLRLGGKNGMSYFVMALVSICIGVVIIIEGAYMDSHTLDILIGAGLIYSGASDFITSFFLSIRMIIAQRNNDKQKEEIVENEVIEDKQDEQINPQEEIIDDQNNIIGQ